MSPHFPKLLLFTIFLSRFILIDSIDKDVNSKLCEPCKCNDEKTTSQETINVTNEALPCYSNSSEELDIIEAVMRGYNKQIMPSAQGVLVDVEMTINDITKLSEIDSLFELDLFFSEIWYDPKLKYAEVIPGICSSNITLSLEFMDQIWRPNICIVNSRSATIHQSPSENVFLILYDDGRVWRNCRMKVEAPCLIDLKRFPFDRQQCTLVLESYSFNAEKVKIQWFKEAPISFVKQIELPDFILIDHVIEHAKVTYPNGRWEQLKVTFYFDRRYGFFILQAYVPTYMTIFVAWINFWMDSSELSTRATLSISAFLAMTLQFGNILKNQPRVSYIKAIDVWMLAGISFLFLALAELAVISYMLRTDKPRKRTKKRKKHDGVSTASLLPLKLNNEFDLLKNGNPCTVPSPSPDCAEYDSVAVRRVIQHDNQKIVNIFIHKTKNRHGQRNDNITQWLSSLTPFDIDWFCLIAYIPLFFIFNLFYWFYYIGVANVWTK